MPETSIIPPQPGTYFLMELGLIGKRSWAISVIIDSDLAKTIDEYIANGGELPIHLESEAQHFLTRIMEHILKNSI